MTAPLVSAHRAGAGRDLTDNSIEAIEAAVSLGCDYVEIDVRLTADGRAVLGHDEPHDGAAEVPLDHALDAMAGRVGAHVDLKTPGFEVALVAAMVERLGVSHVVITTAEDRDVRTIRAWAEVHAPGLLVGLSSSARAHGGRWHQHWAALISSWFPRTRLRRSRANLVVAHRVVARLTLLRYARRNGLPLLVWTVDDPRELRFWMNRRDVWMVTTNYPARALAARR